MHTCTSSCTLTDVAAQSAQVIFIQQAQVGESSDEMRDQTTGSEGERYMYAQHYDCMKMMLTSCIVPMHNYVLHNIACSIPQDLSHTVE